MRVLVLPGDCSTGASELFLDSCCSNRYQERKGGEPREELGPEEQRCEHRLLFRRVVSVRRSWRKFDKLRFGQLPEEDLDPDGEPSLLPVAKLIAISSLSVVLASIVAMCIHSMSEFQSEDGDVDDPRAGGRGDCMHRLVHG